MENRGMGDWMQRIRDVSVVILGGGRGTRLDPLTRMRAKPAVPIAGKYRLIDIPISNCLHSQMDRMVLLTQFNSVSLHRHIAWTYKFDPFSRGFVQILAAQQTPQGERWFQGTADAVRQNLHVVEELRGDLVLILSGDHMYRADYRDMLFDHLEHGADVTIAALPCTEEEISGFGAIRTDESGAIVEFREKPATAEARDGMEVAERLKSLHGLDEAKPYIASMGVYLFRKEALIEALAGDEIDFGNDIIPRMCSTHRVQAHFFKHYWRDIGTIRSFYEAHMDLLTVDPPFNFNDSRWPIYTRPRWLPGARLDQCTFRRAVISDGTRMSESTVEDSIIGINTVVRNATIRRSLIMGVDGPGPEEPQPAPEGAPPIGIGHGSVIEGAIVDKNARIGAGVRVTNERGVAQDEGEGWAIRDGIVVISKGAIIPDGTVI